MVRIVYNGSGFERVKGAFKSPYFGPLTITLFLLFTVPAYLLLTQQSQDIRQQASSISKTGTVSVAPTTGTFKMGEEFVASILLNGNGDNFTAASGNVLVSGNLTIKNIVITPFTSGGCNFEFTGDGKIPTYVDPSFKGIVPQGALPACTLYTLTLQGTSPGTATIAVKNGTMIGLERNDMFSSVTDGIYTITSN